MHVAGCASEPTRDAAPPFIPPAMGGTPAVVPVMPPAGGYARMVDFDAGFEANVQVNDVSGDVNGFLGDYKGIAVQGRDVVVPWTDPRDDMGDVYFARATDAAAGGGPLYKAR